MDAKKRIFIKGSIALGVSAALYFGGKFLETWDENYRESREEEIRKRTENLTGTIVGNPFYKPLIKGSNSSRIIYQFTMQTGDGKIAIGKIRTTIDRVNFYEGLLKIGKTIRMSGLNNYDHAEKENVDYFLWDPVIS